MKHSYNEVLFLFIMIFVMGAQPHYAQLINGTTYRFNAANSSSVGITPTQLIAPNSDNVASQVTDIGFTFWFAGVPYTQFSVNENGLMTLGGTRISGNDFTNNMASTTTLPKIAPYWDDLSTGTNGSVGYQLSGTAPNRVLYVNWNVTVPKNPTGAANAAFQVQLYENGDIFFATPATGFPAANANGYSMGIGISATDFASVTVNATQTASTAQYGISVNNTLTLGGGKRYQFAVDKTPPTINNNTAFSIPNTAGTVNRTISLVVADQAGLPVSGIPVSGSNVPRIYYKKITDVNYVSTAAVLQSGNGTSGTWLFTVDHSLIPGGVAEGDRINYFVVAQDLADYKGSPNIKSYPAGVVAADVNNIITPPAGVPYYTLGASFSGIKTIGTGGDFASLTLPGGFFDQVNAGQLTGNLTVNIISDLTGETGQIGLNAWINSGGTYTITMTPVGNRIISGASVNGGTSNIITLNG